MIVVSHRYIHLDMWELLCHHETWTLTKLYLAYCLKIYWNASPLLLKNMLVVCRMDLLNLLLMTSLFRKWALFYFWKHPDILLLCLLPFIKYFYVFFFWNYWHPNFVTDMHETTMFYAFVKFKDMSSVQNALRVTFPSYGTMVGLYHHYS